MIKKLQAGPILFTFLFSILPQSKALTQSYYPFAEQGKVASLERFSFGISVGVSDYLFFGGNTYNNLLYHKLKSSYDSSFIRDDLATERVFVYNTNLNQEYLWMDFDVNQGDTITVCVPVHLTGSQSFLTPYIIDSVKHINTRDECRKVVYGHSWCHFDIWVEGLGSLLGVPGRYGCVTDVDWNLLIVRQGSDTIYNHTSGQFFCNPNIPPKGSQAPNSPSGE